MTNIAKTAILAKYDYFLLTIEEDRAEIAWLMANTVFSLKFRRVLKS